MENEKSEEKAVEAKVEGGATYPFPRWLELSCVDFALVGKRMMCSKVKPDTKTDWLLLLHPVHNPNTIVNVLMGEGWTLLPTYSTEEIAIYRVGKHPYNLHIVNNKNRFESFVAATATLAKLDIATKTTRTAKFKVELLKEYQKRNKSTPSWLTGAALHSLVGEGVLQEYVPTPMPNITINPSQMHPDGSPVVWPINDLFNNAA